MSITLIRVAAVAEMLDLDSHRVYELARKGVIPCVRIGRQIRFDRDRIEAWIHAGGSALERSDAS